MGIGNNSNNKNDIQDTNNKLNNNSNKKNSNNSVNKNTNPNINNESRKNNYNGNNRNKNKNNNSNDSGNRANNLKGNSENGNNNPNSNNNKYGINNKNKNNFKNNNFNSNPNLSGNNSSIKSKNNSNNQSNKKDRIIDSNKVREDNQSNKSTIADNQRKKGKWHQIDRKYVANMPKRHANKENDNAITELCRVIYSGSLDTLANISKFLEAMQMLEIKNFKIEDAFKIYNYLFDKIYAVNIGPDANPRNELVRRVVNSIKEFTKEKARSENVSEEELIKEKYNMQLREKIVKVITIKNKKQVENSLEYIKYIDMWCQERPLSSSEMKQILSFIQWIPDEELYEKVYIEINNTKELKRELRKIYESAEYQESLIKKKRLNPKVDKNITEDVSKDTLWSDEERRQNNYKVLQQNLANEKPINENKFEVEQVTQGEERQLQKTIQEQKEQDEEITDKSKPRVGSYEEHNASNNTTMNEVLAETLIKQLNLKVASLEKQNSELVNKNVNIEKDRDSINVELEQCQKYVDQLEADKNKLQREIIILDEINAKIQAEKESLQQANETLTTMLEKGKNFELDAYKSKLKSKLQFEYQQYLDTQEIIQAGVGEDIAGDVIELLYELAKNIWKVLKDNDISYGDK